MTCLTGNDNLHALTSGGRPQALRVDITDWNGVYKFASYGSFAVGGEEDNYPLRVGNFSTLSTAGDSLTARHNGMLFSTHDRDNDKCKILLFFMVICASSSTFPFHP